MIVYRIEHETRDHGPYIIPFVDGDYDNEYDNEYDDLTGLAYLLVSAHQDEEHPPPNTIHSNEICGFDSMDALLAWFDGFLADLAEYGYVIRSFQGENVRHDSYGQVTFHKELSNCLTSQPI
jgi:hypothetical protein